MRVGDTYGPYVGLFWIDPVTRVLTLKPGTKRITAEITRQLTEDETHGLMDGLMEQPHGTRGAGSVMKSRRVARMLTPIEGGKR